MPPIPWPPCRTPPPFRWIGATSPPVAASMPTERNSYGWFEHSAALEGGGCGASR
uniref:Uncharacterized protein n=1 Tax=Arundo donax TaxID=35708 RepID=A0A0A8Y4U0_ARUDO